MEIAAFNLLPGCIVRCYVWDQASSRNRCGKLANQTRQQGNKSVAAHPGALGLRLATHISVRTVDNVIEYPTVWLVFGGLN